MLGSIVAIIFSACKKDSASRQSLITGSWSETQVVTDNNGNGQPDDTPTPVSSANAITIKFNTDGSGTVTQNLSGTPISIPFAWSLKNSDTILEVVAGSNTTDLTIVELSSSKLTVKDSTGSVAEWEYFSK